MAGRGAFPNRSELIAAARRHRHAWVELVGASLVDMAGDALELVVDGPDRIEVIQSTLDLAASCAYLDLRELATHASALYRDFADATHPVVLGALFLAYYGIPTGGGLFPPPWLARAMEISGSTGS